MANEIYVLEPDVSPSKQSVKGIVQPLSCIVEQEENGVYSVEMELPAKDSIQMIRPQNKQLVTSDGKIFVTADGRSFHTADIYADVQTAEDISIAAFDVLKVPIKRRGVKDHQLFRVGQITNRSYYAEHIFYDLRWKVLPMGANWDSPAISGADYSGYGADVLSTLLTKTLNAVPAETRFSYSSDMIYPKTEHVGYYFQQDRISLAAALLDGADSFVGRFGGYIYRDNFRFSINSETEGNRHAGYVVYADNMAGITCTEDWSDCCTRVIASDNYGDHIEVGLPSVSNEQFPHPIYKQIKIEYQEHQTAADVAEQFKKDVQEWFRRHTKPVVSISVDVAEIENDPRYKDFVDLASYEVGDTVDVRNKKYNIDYTDLRIIRKKYDVLSEKTLEYEIGDFRQSFTRNEYYSGVITEV